MTGDARYLDSVQRGFAYYKRGYYDQGLVAPDAMVFFANWQSQTGRPLGIALAFLVRAQRTTGCTARERGGFGGSLTSGEQQIDVTGHVASGFIKTVENGITEPAA